MAMANMHPNLEPSMDTCTRIALIRSGLQKVFKRYNEPDAPIFDLRDEAVKLLRSVNLPRKRNFSAKHVGVHFKNRYGDGLIVAHVGKLALKFTIRGFSLEELGIPRATAMPPAGHPRRTQFEAFNKELVDKSNGTLPEFEPNEIEILSGQKTHTSQSCRCVLKGAPCDDTRVATDGKYCMDKIRSLRPSYAQVCLEGMEWEVIPWAVEDEFELIMNLIQETGNAAGTSFQS